MTVATRADAPRFEVDAYEFRPLAVPSRGSKELAVWAIDAGPGADGVPHQHDREAVFVVNTGRMAGEIAGVSFEAGPGDAIIVPANVTFALRNASAEEPASLTVTAPIGMQAILDGKTFSAPWTL